MEDNELMALAGLAGPPTDRKLLVDRKLKQKDIKSGVGTQGVNAASQRSRTTGAV